ncbi:MAG: hypothetical protein IPO87_05750 [Flavobacteriales bacterium]|nr:hypothetical protein [Flavobacteriales bacterium]
MRTLIRSLALYIAIFLGMAATAQNAVTVTGTVSLASACPIRFVSPPTRHLPSTPRSTPERIVLTASLSSRSRHQAPLA